MLSLRSLTLAAGALFAVGLLLPQTSAQTLTDVDPAAGTRGTVVTITGTALGGKPKVWLTREGDKKKYKLKVAKGGTDTEVMAAIKKAVAGDFTMHVQPKGADELTTDFTILAPVITDVSPSTAMPGDEVVLTVQDAGTPKPKPKVTVGGKKAKVVSVEDQVVAFNGAGLFSLITVIMPKKLANGSWDIALDNKIAMEIQAAAMQITGSDVSIGKPTLTLDVDGGNVKLSKKATAFIVTDDLYTLQGGAGNNPNKTVRLIFVFDPDNDTTPTTITDEGGSLIEGVTYIETTLDGLIPTITTWGAPFSGSDWTININSSSGGQVGGNYSGTLKAAGQPDRVVAGDFIVDND